MPPSITNNVYQINQKTAMTVTSNKPIIGTPHKVMRPNENVKNQYQYRTENIYPQSPGKVINPHYMMNNFDKRQNLIVQNQQRVSRQESIKKPSFYSPQGMKDAYYFSPQKVTVHQIQEPHAQKNCSPMPNNYIKQ